MKPILSVLALLHTSLSFACSCGWQGSFLTLAQNPKAIIVIATVIEYIYDESEEALANERRDQEVYAKLGIDHEYRNMPIAMIIEVGETIKGKTHQESILVYGDNGTLCRPYVSEFPIGTEWALILFEHEGAFAISNCGEYWLEKVGSILRGSIRGERERRIKRKISLEELKNEVRANQTPEPTAANRPHRLDGRLAINLQSNPQRV